MGKSRWRRWEKGWRSTEKVWFSGQNVARGDHEDFCLLFEAMQSDKDELLVLVVDERYVSKESYSEHRKSEAFHEFRRGLGDLS